MEFRQIEPQDDDQMDQDMLAQIYQQTEDDSQIMGELLDMDIWEPIKDDPIPQEEREPTEAKHE